MRIHRPAIAAAAALAFVVASHTVARSDDTPKPIETARRGVSLPEARACAEAVTLDDGRILIVGGFSGQGLTFAQDALIYDPVARTTCTVASISGEKHGRMWNGTVPVRRAGFQATTLADGRVLISGGYGIEKRGVLSGKEKVDVLRSLHLFDPKTNCFTPVGKMTFERHGHTATLRPDGSVIFIGGYGDQHDRFESPPAEIWSLGERGEGRCVVANELPSPLADERYNRIGHTAVPLDGGARVLITGGSQWTGPGLFGLIKPKLKMNPTALLYASSQSDLPSSAPFYERQRHVAGRLASGDVVVMGGDDNKNLVAAVETWNPETRSWRERAALSFPRLDGRIAVSGSKAAIVGGLRPVARSLREVLEIEVFDEKSGRVTAPVRLIEGRRGCAVAPLGKGRFLVIGGFFGGSASIPSGEPLASTEIFELR